MTKADARAVIAQGEYGDTFYIVEAGVCNVLGSDGRTLGQRLGWAPCASAQPFAKLLRGVVMSIPVVCEDEISELPQWQLDTGPPIEATH